MEVIVTLEHRFMRTPDGRVWSKTMFAYPFWQRYLEVFDSVKIVARAKDVSSVDSTWKLATGDNVRFHAVPYYHGPAQFLRRFRQVRAAVRSAYNPHSAVIMRVGSTIGDLLIPVLKRNKHPFGLEVVGDPWDVFAPGAVRHPLRPLIRRWSTARLRRQCQHAAAVAYVTEFALQRRYPPAPDAFTTHYSSIELPAEAFAAEPRSFTDHQGRFRVISVGSMETMYKGMDVLIDAVAQCRRNGFDVELVLIGDGKHRPELEARAAGHGIAEHVHFRGQLSSGQAVRDELDQADLFVLASRTEGLPRAVIEAMARGLPCIGSRVGGIPELLPTEDLVPPGDADTLARKISEVSRSPERMAAMSRRNLKKAADYRDDVLRQRRNAFYEIVKERTEGARTCVRG